MKNIKLKIPAFDRLLESFLENSAVIAWMKDSEGRHVFLSENYKSRFVATDDWLGKTDFEIWPREIAEYFWQNDLAVLESGRTMEVEEKAINPDGTVSWWLNHKFLFEDSAKRRYVGGLGVDITRRKQAEDAKLKFLTRMSHEFRTPLHAILGFSQVLQIDRHEPLLPEQKKAVDQILHSGEHLLELVNDLLDLAAVEAGKIEMDIQGIDLMDTVRHCLDTITPIAGQHNIRLNNTLMDTCTGLYVRADITRLRQVLLNLLSNAVKYNRAGGSVTVACEPAGDGKIQLRVTDTGIGIPEADIPALFEPFSRVYLKTYAREGTGIGLNICKNLVEMMDGQIGVDSVPGQGSTFWIELPASPPPATTAAKMPSGDEADPVVSGDETLLIYIEDNPDHIQLVQTIIGTMPGIRLLTAQTGKKGLALARAHPPDIIICDIGLPDMSGYDILEKLRDSDITRDVPVIALSANTVSSQIEKGLHAGFHRYLTKPVNVAEFIKAVDEMKNAVPEKAEPNQAE